MDLAIVQRFTRSLTRIETGLVADELRLYREFRLAALGSLLGVSLRPYELRRELEAHFSVLARAAAMARRQRIAAANEAAKAYGEQLRQALLRAGVNAAEPQGLATQAAEQAIRAALDPEPDWVDVVRGRTLADLSRLSAIGADAEQIAMELLSERVVNGRVSAWRAGRASLETGEQLNLWGAVSGAIGVIFAGINAASEARLERQAIAAIDEKTTDCCLRVHGQIVGQDQPFHLTGTPRFADYVPSPPFHWFCRTATAIYHVAMEAVGVSTETMRTAARDELAARERTKGRVEIHPAHAMSRRN